MPNETPKERHRLTAAYNLRRVRLLRGWSQEKLAAEAKVTRQQVIRWESGRDYEPGPFNLEKLCAALEVDEREFRTPIPVPEPEPV